MRYYYKIVNTLLLSLQVQKKDKYYYKNFPIFDLTIMFYVKI